MRLERVKRGLMLSCRFCRVDEARMSRRHPLTILQSFAISTAAAKIFNERAKCQNRQRHVKEITKHN
jgi:hypothetical protein